MPWHLVEAVVLAMPHQGERGGNNCDLGRGGPGYATLPHPGAYGYFEMVIFKKVAKVVLTMPHPCESGAYGEICPSLPIVQSFNSHGEVRVPWY